MEELTLSQLNTKIKDTLKNNLDYAYNIIAEISEMHVNNGHAYLELVEKNSKQQTIAKIRATVWASTFRMLQPYFETTTGHKFRAGIKVLVKITVEFSEIYGLSLNIRDIDPTYTLGDIEQKRLEIIKRLKEEGVLEMNKETELPFVPQKIAIISSSSAAGYGDFIEQLSNNKFGYKFYTKLFEAYMQGENTEESVISGMDKVYENEDIFDVLVIIRGGGSKSDLSYFDNYNIALNVSQFPMPVITGIGHERDNSITDIVAHTALKTPTAVADFLISELNSFETDIDESYYQLRSFMSDFIEIGKNTINDLSDKFIPFVNSLLLNRNTEYHEIAGKLSENVKLFINNNIRKIENIEKYNLSGNLKSYFFKENIALNNQKNNLLNASKSFLKNKNHDLEISEHKIKNINPENILKMGYSFTTNNGKIVKKPSDVNKGDIIETRLSEGKIKSVVD